MNRWLAAFLVALGALVVVALLLQQNRPAPSLSSMSVQELKELDFELMSQRSDLQSAVEASRRAHDSKATEAFEKKLNQLQKRQDAVKLELGKRLAKP